MKLFIIPILISYAMDCCAEGAKPMTRQELYTYGQHLLMRQTTQFVGETVTDIYNGVLAATAESQRSGYIHKINPPNSVLLYSPIDYIELILERLRVLFPDSEVEFRSGSGVNVYYGMPQTTPNPVQTVRTVRTVQPVQTVKPVQPVQPVQSMQPQQNLRKEL